jgi:YHS domain-containing protein
VSPIRILILVILFYIAFRLIFGGKKKAETRSTGAGMGTSNEDILEQDPICGKLVPRKQAVTLDVAGKAVYFCSVECSQQYRKKKGDAQ